MYSVKKSWKSFNISLDELSNQLKTDFPESEVNPVFKGIQAVGDGEQNAIVIPGYLELWFDKPIEGYSKNEDGELVAEEGSDAETIEDLWNAIDENHIIATSYVSNQDLLDAEVRAREDAASKDWDNLSTEQKKIISGASLTLADRKQILTDHPA